MALSELWNELSVGRISGVIAAGVVLLQFLIPNALVLLLVHVLSERHSAVTWSVASRQLQISLWPLILRSDTVATGRTPRSVAIIAWARPVTLFILAVAAIVTPLGLHEMVVLDDAAQSVIFEYVPDTGPLGVGTPGRSAYGFGRSCSGNCPGSSGPYNLSELGPHQYPDMRIPDTLGSVYQSGLAQHNSTVSNFFDIQYRQFHSTGYQNINNDTHLVGDLQILASKVLDDAYILVEGLIVDYKRGGVGFRNHTGPRNLQFAAEWEEEISFWYPETSCTDMNLTLRFQVKDPYNFSLDVQQWIVDKGGFAMLNRTNPFSASGQLLDYGEDLQHDPQLHERAYRTAWAVNRDVMYLFNISEPDTNLSRISSAIGDSFETTTNIYLGDTEYSQAFTSIHYEYLPNAPYDSDLGNKDRPVPNPYNISTTNFTGSATEAGIGQACQLYLDSDPLDMDQIDISCGMVYGSGKQSNGQALSAAPAQGTEWERPLYSCASATRMSLKTVRFRFNGTGTSLEALEILSIKDKAYPNLDSMPLWGMEIPHNASIGDILPLYGLVDPEVAENAINLTVKRADHWYLPANKDSVRRIASLGLTDFLPSSNGPGAIWTAVYSTLESSDNYNNYLNTHRYVGGPYSDLSRRWAELTSNVTNVPTMLNLIWTDVAANSFVGTRSWLTRGKLPPNLVHNGISAEKTASDHPLRRQESGTRAEDPANIEDLARDDLIASVPVYLYTRRIRYNWLYAIPMAICLTITLVIFLCALVSMFLGNSVAKLRYYLMHLSTGRVMASFLYPQWETDKKRNIIEGSTAAWVEAVGLRTVGIRGADTGLRAHIAFVGEDEDEVGDTTRVSTPPDRRCTGPYTLVPQTGAVP